MRRVRALLVGGLLILSACLGACSSDDGDGGTTAPPINRFPNVSISSSSQFISFVPGDVVTLTATGSDADGDPLSYAWEIDDLSVGTLDALVGDTVIFTAVAFGSTIVSVVANDGTADSLRPDETSMRVGTAVPGATLVADATWLAAASPYIVTDDVLVGAGATLSIDPGTELEFRGGPRSGGGFVRPSFTIEGVLHVNGAPGGGRVRWRGGRTGQGNERQWGGIVFAGGLPSWVRGSDIENADTGVTNRGRGAVSLFDCLIRDNVTGVSSVDPDGATDPGVDRSSISLREVTVEDNLANGILINSSDSQLAKCVIRDNAAFGILVQASSDFTSAVADSLIIGEHESGGLGFSAASAPLSIDFSDCNFDVFSEAAVNVDWGVCPNPPFAQIDLTGNYWGEGTTSILEVLGHMEIVVGCDPEVDQWVENVDWFGTPRF